MAEQEVKKKVTVLSIDGGGIRGLIPAAFLAALEAKIQELEPDPNARLADYFDLIVGTSTGGLLALLYTTPNADNTKPKYSAKDAVDLFKNHGPNIFKSSWHSGFTNYFRAKYSPDYLEQILGEKLGDTTLADMYTATALMAFNITTDSSYAFRSWKADKSDTIFMRSTSLEQLRQHQLSFSQPQSRFWLLIKN
jgi:patatin-like phospholipase/acyl hydrolase